MLRFDEKTARLQARLLFWAMLTLAPLSLSQSLEIKSEAQTIGKRRDRHDRKIVIDPACFDFGEIPIGSKRATIIKVYFDGGGDFGQPQIGSRLRCLPDSCINAYYPPTGEIGGSLSWTYPPGSRDTVLIVVELSPADTISYCHSTVIKSEFSKTESAVFSYGGLGVAAVAEFSSTVYDFGDVLSNTSAALDFTIKNIGRDTLKIKDLSFRSGIYFDIEPKVDFIAPRSRQEFRATFNPIEVGDYSDLLRLKSNALYGDDALRVRGRGFDGPGIAFEPTAIAFDTCLGTTQTKSVFVRNIGNDTLTIFGIASPDPTSLPPPMINAPLNIPVGQKAPLKFLFTSRSETSIAGQYRALSNRNGGDSTLQVSTNARKAAFRLVPTPKLLQPIEAIVGSCDSAAFFIDNPSACPLFVHSIIVSPETLGFSASTSNITLQPRAQTAVWVYYKPTKVGKDTAEVIVQAEYFASPETLQVYGEGLPAAIFVLDSTQMRFDEVCVRKHAFKSVRVRNEGRGLMVIDDIVTGTSGVFTIYPRPSPEQPLRLGPGGEQVFAVKFQPKDTVQYDEVITFDAQAEGKKKLAVQGRGIEAELQADTVVLAFGEVVVGDSLERMVVLKNRIGKPIVIDSLKLWPSRTPFSVSPRSVTLDSLNDFVVVQVKFKPETPAEYYAKLVIHHNVDCADDTITLSGTGRMPVKFTAPNRHDFESVQVHRSRSWDFNFENKGDAPLRVQIDYPDSSTFGVNSISDLILNGVVYQAQISFRPQELRSYNDSLVFCFKDYPQFRHCIQLTGVGIDTIGPVITSALSCKIYNVGDSIELSATFKDEVTHAQNQTLYYRRGGEKEFTEQSMIAVTGDTWKGVVPSGFLTECGLDYFFSAHDNSGNSSRNPVGDYYGISVNLPEGLTRPKPLHAGRSERDYRMISIPLILDKANVSEILSKNALREENRDVWQCFDYHNGSFVELTGRNASSFRPFQPGRAFWLLTAGLADGFQSDAYWEALKTNLLTQFRVGSGKTAALGFTGCEEVDQYRQLDLEPGWNMIANPYPFPITKNRLRIVGQTTPVGDMLMAYDGCWKSAPDTLLPWEGYAIKIGAPGQLAFHDLPQPAVLPNENNGDYGWSLQIIARTGAHEDAFNFAGVHSEAAQEWDGRDVFEPPALGACVSLAFPHREWAQNPDLYAGDFRSPFSKGEVWEFEVTTALKENWTTLQFKNVVSLPSRLSVYLYDKNRRVFQNLRERFDYGYTELGELLPGRFKLIVGTETYLETHLARAKDTPTEFQLYQNFPNPFREETIFSFYLPEAAPVWMKVFDVLGREVVVLSNGRVWERGRNWLRWSGIDNHSFKVGSGHYLLVVQSGKFHVRQRITLLK